MKDHTHSEDRDAIPEHQCGLALDRAKVKNAQQTSKYNAALSDEVGDAKRQTNRVVAHDEFVARVQIVPARMPERLTSLPSERRFSNIIWS